jgi:hypothetical protein
MKRYITFVVTVLLLVVVLAIPAAASKPVAVAGDIVSEILWDETWDVGNRCFATGEGRITLDGDFVGTGVHEFWSVGHGPCAPEPGPFQLVETFREQGTFVGTVLGKPGTFVYRCQNVWRPEDPDTLKLDCTIRSGTGELSSLHGHFEVRITFPPPFTFVGEVHFDGK